MVEVINGQYILKLMVERKSVPASAVKLELERRCKQIEAERGSKPQRKEKKAMKEDVIRDLMPRAFSKRSSHYVWIDPVNAMLVVDTSSEHAASLVVERVLTLMTALEAAPSLSMLKTKTSPQVAMSTWLTSMEAPFAFTVDRDLELKEPDNDQAVVRYVRHNLQIDEVVQHIANGKLPITLAMTFDSHVSFVLTTNLALKRIELLDDVFTDNEDASAGFDGDVAMATGELSKLIPALIAALDGEADDPTQDESSADNPE